MAKKKKSAKATVSSWGKKRKSPNVKIGKTVKGGKRKAIGKSRVRGRRY